jgi:hypothetical protein
VPVQSPIVAASLPATTPVLFNKRLAEHDPAGVWDVSIEYPAFAGGSTPWASQLNDDVLALERMQADMFEQGPAAQRQQAGKANHLVGSYSSDLLTPELASFTLIWSDDTAPGNLTTTVGTLNVDLSTGQPIAFDDLFADPDAALQILSVQSADLLYYQLGAAWEPTTAQQGTTPTHDNFANWALTRNGLKVTFNQFQVIHSEQIPAVTVPWSALAPVVVSSGPVAVLAGVAPAPGSAAPSSSASPGPSASASAGAIPSRSAGPSPSASLP